MAVAVSLPPAPALREDAGTEVPALTPAGGSGLAGCSLPGPLTEYLHDFVHVMSQFLQPIDRVQVILPNFSPLPSPGRATPCCYDTDST